LKGGLGKLEWKFLEGGIGWIRVEIFDDVQNTEYS